MQPIHLDIVIPESWNDLTDQQLRYVFSLISNEFNSDELKTLCLLQWSKIKVIGRQESGSFLVKKDKLLFEITPITLAELLPYLNWLTSIPNYPVRLSQINHCHALPADFSEVPFEKFIMADNLYQGFLATHDDSLLDELASVLYGKAINLKPQERISIFYWMSSLKDFFAHKFPDFFQPIDTYQADGNLLGSATTDVEAAMNAQIRALTKGDITKEAHILAMDTWRALTELNAQAKEYKELNSKIKSK